MNKLIEDSLKALEDAEKDRDKEHRKKMEDMSIKFFGEEYLRNWLKYERGGLKIIGTKFSLVSNYDDGFFLCIDNVINFSAIVGDLESLGRAVKETQGQEIPEKKSWWKRLLG